MEEPVTLSKTTLKALSSGARLRILKALEQKQQTQTDLAHLLNLKIPTIKEHLTLLKNEGLVIVKEEGRKWKYYHLTDKGRTLLNPEDRTIKLLLFSLTGIAAATAASLYFRLKQTLPETNEALRATPAAEELAAPAIQESATALTKHTTPFPLTTLSNILIGLTLFLLALLLYFKFFKKNRRQNI